ncbi:MAG: S41 family peptidase [Candidatus Cloacimonadaceae bacterium]|nr:S41 family peptidase [Candidatus Cloacimonadota bacterium]MDX9950171.1 S41 family peptidase [Candidatus Syntrophosphaera sp.]
MIKNKQKTALLTIAAVWILTAIMLFTATGVFAQNQGNGSDLYSQLGLFSEVLSKLKQSYVTELSDEELIKAAIIGMLGSTDPHTTYFTKSEYEDFTTSTKGSFGGLGIQIDKIGDYVTVISPIEGTPAYRMGITAGDKIIRVNDKSIVGLSTDEAIKYMRGDVGTTVIITISRPGVSKPLEFKITRETIKIKSVPYSFKMDNGAGYLRLSQFNENTVQELRAALASLEAEGITGLIIDLRSNPGGLLDQAVDTVNEFIGPNKLVVETKGRMPNANRQYLTRFNTKARNYPIIVLVNEASASASEIFAGSLQDWDKGLVMGKTTFGKGSVQQLLPLMNGNGIKITTAYYYIKSGRCIHKKSNDQILLGKEVNESDINAEEELNLKQVYHTVKNREVYGGGGITPDIEADGEPLTNFAVELRRKNAFFNFAVDYMVEHDHKLDKNLVVGSSLLNSFLAYASSRDIKYTQADVDSTDTYLRTMIKSELLRAVHGDLEAYKATIGLDKQLQQAVALMNRFKTMDELFAHAAAQNKKQ